MVATDIRSQQFQTPRKFFTCCSNLLPHCYSSATKGGKNGVNKFFVTEPWPKSINKRAFKGERFYGLPLLIASLVVGKRRREACVQERGKSPFDKGLVTQPHMPSLVPADHDLPKPIILTEKEEKTPKNIVGSEICTVDICSSEQ